MDKLFFEHYLSVVSLYLILLSLQPFEDFILIVTFKWFFISIFLLITVSLASMIDLLSDC